MHMPPDIEEPARAAEVHALARRLEARARKERDTDLLRAGVLLRLLMAIMTDDGTEAGYRHCQDVGRVH
jgi:hypothetical protein